MAHSLLSSSPDAACSASYSNFAHPANFGMTFMTPATHMLACMVSYASILYAPHADFLVCMCPAHVLQWLVASAVAWVPWA